MREPGSCSIIHVLNFVSVAGKDSLLESAYLPESNVLLTGQGEAPPYSLDLPVSSLSPGEAFQNAFLNHLISPRLLSVFVKPKFKDSVLSNIGARSVTPLTSARSRGPPITPSTSREVRGSRKNRLGSLSRGSRFSLSTTAYQLRDLGNHSAETLRLNSLISQLNPWESNICSARLTRLRLHTLKC